MIKILVLLFCTSVIVFSAGCGDAANAVDDVKKDAAAQIQETAGEVKDAAGKVEQKAAEFQGENQPTRNVTEKFSIGGIYPGMTLEEVKKILGEPVSSHDNDEFIFKNGLVVEVEKHGDIVEEIQTHQAGATTGAGIEVGMTEQKLIETYGAADYVENHGNKIEYKYHSADRLMKIEFEIYNEIIAEIKAELND